jgi:LacI family transcriptional regulator
MTRHLAILSHGFAFDWPIKLTATIRELTKETGQRVTQYPTRVSAETSRKHCETIAQSSEPTALICLSCRPEPESAKLLLGRGIPIVCIDERCPGASTVAIDNYQGGYLVGEHLANIGRKHMAMVCGQLDANGGYNAVERLRGFRAAIAAHGLSLDDRDIVQVVSYDYHDGQVSMDALLSSRRPMDAIFCAAGDDCAAGMLSVALDRKVRIPDAIAIVGFDDKKSAADSTPPLTTIRQSIPELAKAAHEIASDPGTSFVRAPRTVTLHPELVVRASAPAAAFLRGAA